MVERIVTDRDRVAACQSFWRSRFQKWPSPGEIRRITGLSLERIEQAMKAPIPQKPPKPRENLQGGGNVVEVERLTCQSCSGTFTRRKVRGPKPRRCPGCR